MKATAPITLCLVAAILATGFQSDQARLEMETGKRDYQSAYFLGAIEHFKAAVDLDNNWVAAKFALAAAYVGQYVPTLDTPENERYAQQAIEIFLKILERDPKNANALRDIALLSMYSGKSDQSREYFKKAIAAAPDDPELYYSLGVLDWVIVFRDVKSRKAKRGLGMDDEFGDSPSDRRLCAQIRTHNQAYLDEGLAMLQKAMEKQKDYDAAMAYTYLLYGRKADLECGNPQARSEDMRRSHKWREDGLAAWKRNAASDHGRANDDELETGKLGSIMPPPVAPPWPGEKRSP